MSSYRKKPVVVEAWQFVRVSDAPMPPWLHDALNAGTVWHQRSYEPYLAIRTLEGNRQASVGDWIIRGVKGELYPVKDEIFRETYEPADSRSAPAGAPEGALTDELVRTALQDAWNDYCDDAQAFPDCFQIQRGPKLYADFSRCSNFVLMVRHALEAGLLSAAPPARPVSQAVTDVLAERRRQVEQEGWTPEHDDQHRGGAMARASACYALSAGYPPSGGIASTVAGIWPWAMSWWKPKDRRSDMVRSVALGIAEIERLDRAASAAASAEGAQTQGGEGRA